MDNNSHTGSSPVAEFPIFTGGPFYRLQQWIRLVRDGRRRLGLAALYAVLVAWAPMALLSAWKGWRSDPRALNRS